MLKKYSSFNIIQISAYVQRPFKIHSYKKISTKYNNFIAIFESLEYYIIILKIVIWMFFREKY